jgi:hypothetical protein
MMELTLDELLAELAGEPERLEGYRSMLEWGRHLGISQFRARDLLLLAKSQGRLLVGRQTREALDGRRTSIPVYSFALRKHD